MWKSESPLGRLKSILNFSQEHRELGIAMEGFTQSFLVSLLLKVGDGFIRNISDLVHFGLQGEPLISILKLGVKTCGDENTSTFVLVSCPFDERERLLTEHIEFSLWRGRSSHPRAHQHFAH